MPMVAVYGTDRAWRTTLEAALRGQGVLVRTASRPAELAKCLNDGAVRLVIAAPTERPPASDGAAPHGPWIQASPGETAEALVHRAIGVLQSQGVRPA